MAAIDGQTPAADSGASPSSLTGRIRRSFTERKQRLLEESERIASEREAWIARHHFFYDEDWRYMRFLVPRGKRVLDLGCGAGELLDAVQPAEGIGVDFSQAMIDRAKTGFPAQTFVRGDVENLEDVAEVEGEFDVIIMSDTVGSLDDCLETFRSLKRFCKPQTRVIVTYQSRIWEPLILLYAWLTTRQPVLLRNWLSSQDIANLLDLADFDVIKREWRILCPFRLFGLGSLINRYIATLPLIRKICLRNYVVARPQPRRPLGDLSTTIVIPCRNERDNIEAAIRRIPAFCTQREIIFVEGGSSDGTWERIQQVIAQYPQFDIKALKQTGTGKGDAVRTGFAEARGDVLMILDADLTMPPEDLPKFYEALVSAKGEFINGSRLVYPMEKQAMRLLNLLANYIFAQLFTYLLNQRHTDTLCGTKALLRENYDEISRNRAYFGNFDPFGDFDLLFGASKLNLKTAEVPIRYAARVYGETQISRFRHGWLLLRMVCFAFMKLKAL
jgi:SAM-dependent methyltransferase